MKVILTILLILLSKPVFANPKVTIRLDHINKTVVRSSEIDKIKEDTNQFQQFYDTERLTITPNGYSYGYSWEDISEVKTKRVEVSGTSRSSINTKGLRNRITIDTGNNTWYNEDIEDDNFQGRFENEDTIFNIYSESWRSNIWSK